MKVKLLVVLMFLTTSLILKAQEQRSNIEITEKQIIISPKKTQSTLGVAFNLDKETYLKILVKNENDEILFDKDYDNVKKASYKIDLSSLKSGNYDVVIVSEKKIIYKEQIIKF